MEIQGFKYENNKSSRPNSLPFKIFVCKHCGRKFLNSQALGGHQNAHKKERRREASLHNHEMKSTTFASFGMPLVPYNIIQSHGRAPHMNMSTSTSMSMSLSSIDSSSEYPISKCSKVAGVEITNQLKDAVDEDYAEKVGKRCASSDYQSGLELELPDLNLDPSL